MRVNGSKTLGRQAVRTSRVRRILRARALDWAPKVAARTAVDSGDTKASTRVESGHLANDGRPAARIVQTGAPVPQNWRQDRDYIVRAIGGGL